MLGYYIHDLNPFLIEFGSGWGIRYYGLAYVTGFLAWYYGLRWFRTKGWSVLSDEQISDSCSIRSWVCWLEVGSATAFSMTGRKPLEIRST